MVRFEKLRVSLARDSILPLLSEANHVETFRSRREFLEAAFAKERSFLHGRSKKRFDFIPLPIDGNYVAGIFRRHAPVTLHDETLTNYDADNYEAAVVIISVNKDQITWVQHNSRVGSTKSVLESFFKYLSEKMGINDWKVYVEYLHDEREYFSVIRSRRRDIAKITFTFIPPNALSADDEVYNFVKVVQQEAGPDLQQHVYKAEPGKMNPDTEHMNASARVAMAGGGDAEVRDRSNRIIYSSARARVTKEVPSDDLPTPQNGAFVRRIRDWLFEQ